MQQFCIPKYSGINVFDSGGMSPTVGEMSATVGEMSATVGKLNML